MILASSNKLRQFLFVTYIGRIRPAELKQGREELKSLLAELKPGFSLLVNMSCLESMGMDCRTEIGRNMDLVSQSGVSRLVYVIPDPAKDIGMNILAFFHYPNHPKIIHCKNLAEGVEKLLSGTGPAGDALTGKK